MKHSEKLDEIVNMLKLLTAKNDSIETALMEKVDRTSLDDFSVKLSNVESAVDKLTHTSADLRKELNKSVDGIKHSNAKLGDTFQCKIDEKVEVWKLRSISRINWIHTSYTIASKEQCKYSFRRTWQSKRISRGGKTMSCFMVCRNQQATMLGLKAITL